MPRRAARGGADGTVVLALGKDSHWAENGACREPFPFARGNTGRQAMNDLHHPCEDWAKPVSLAVAGCLPPEEERGLHRHIQTCSGCRERFGQLTQLCGALLNCGRRPTVRRQPSSGE